MTYCLEILSEEMNGIGASSAGLLDVGHKFSHTTCTQISERIEYLDWDLKPIKCMLRIFVYDYLYVLIRKTVAEVQARLKSIVEVIGISNANQDGSACEVAIVTKWDQRIVVSIADGIMSDMCLEALVGLSRELRSIQFRGGGHCDHASP